LQTTLCLIPGGDGTTGPRDHGTPTKCVSDQRNDSTNLINERLFILFFIFFFSLPFLTPLSYRLFSCSIHYYQAPAFWGVMDTRLFGRALLATPTPYPCPWFQPWQQDRTRALESIVQTRRGILGLVVAGWLLSPRCSFSCQC
jgi:hypothetical protein